MYENDEPLKAAPISADASPKAQSPKLQAILEPQDRAPSVARKEDLLFEDILDVEGPLRTALAGTTGDVVPADACTTGVLGSIESISVRVDAPVGVLLRAQSQDLHLAAEAGDADRLRIALAALVDTLSTLRGPRA